MTKVKYLVLIFIVAILLLVFPNIANAAVEYTRTIPSSDGTIKINLKNLTLNENEAYEFALVRQGVKPEKWFSIDDGYTSTTASITLSSGTTEIRDVLKVTDTGYIYIRKQNDETDTYVLEAYKVNLKLPYLQSLSYEKDSDEYIVTKLIYNEIGNYYEYTGGNNTYTKWEKINDKNFIEDFLDIKNNSKDITNIETSLSNPPTTGWDTDRSPSYKDKNDGLYLLWVKRTGENCKEVYSCIVHDGLPDATKVEQYIAGLDVEKPTVHSIAVTSPTSGVYKTGQTVKLTVTFSEEITGTTVPTLKIRFGTSEERTLTNGTISGKTIVYSYNIANGDKGQLAVTGYTGGTIKDAAGNDATISSKTVSGNTIKANVEGEGTGTESDKVSVESVSLNQTKITLEKGKTATLVATVKPTNATNTAVTYKSSNESIAKVDSKGVITAVAKGTATITVTTTDGQKTATCEVTVTEKTEAGEGKVSVESISLNQTKVSLEKGKTTTLVATVKPTNATNKAVTYKSSNESVAKVDSKGVITAVAKGTATITVTTADGQKTATCEVTVTEVANTADGTKAPGKIPQAGMEMGIIVAIVVLISVGAVVYSRYKKMSDI